MTQESLTVNIWWSVNFRETVVFFAFLHTVNSQNSRLIPLDGITDCFEGLNVP